MAYPFFYYLWFHGFEIGRNFLSYRQAYNIILVDNCAIRVLKMINYNNINLAHGLSFEVMA